MSIEGRSEWSCAAKTYFRSYTILEDNDSTGYKSSKARAAKEELHIKPMDFPRFSPDLSPMDFSLWTAIEGRMDGRAPKGAESVVAHKKRLRLTALRLPESIVKKAMSAIPQRAWAVVQAKGKTPQRPRWRWWWRISCP